MDAKRAKELSIIMGKNMVAEKNPFQKGYYYGLHIAYGDMSKEMNEIRMTDLSKQNTKE